MEIRILCDNIKIPGGFAGRRQWIARVPVRRPGVKKNFRLRRAVQIQEEVRMKDRIFEQEQEHLTQTYDTLLEMKGELEGKLESTYQEAAAEKDRLRDDITLNFDTDTDTIETYGEFEVMNHVIDDYNIKADAMRDTYARVKQLLDSPYFARVTLQFDPEEEPEDYYIGSVGLSQDAWTHLVIDWRSPIAETYYNQENGKTSYEVDGRRVPVDLLLRRQFELNKNELLHYFDTQVAIEDPLLLKSLSRRHGDKMTAITTTIQKEQNAIIRMPDVPVLLVNGIAGSGKTSVLLQRIAYLFYKKRDTLRPEQVTLMTLNPVFRQYIDNVLPDMGEMNPLTLTWGDFLRQVGVPLIEETDGTDPHTLHRIDAVLPHFRLEPSDIRPVTQKGTCILSAEQIVKTLEKYPNLETGVRLIQVAIDDLVEQAKMSAATIERKNAEMIGEEVPAGATSEKEEKRLVNTYGGAFHMIHRAMFLDIDRIGQRLLGVKKLTPAQWLYLKMALTGICDRNTKYVMIDEVQDYTKAQLMVLRRYYPMAKFMLLGDEYQAIRPGTVDFAQIHEIFEVGRNKVSEMPLMTSYRSTPEITDLFTTLMPERTKVLTSSVQRPGTPVGLAAYGRNEYKKKLRELTAEAKERTEGITAVVCADAQSVSRAADIMGRDNVQVIRRNDPLPQSGLIVLELVMAKGLEFDQVILPDADAGHYPDDLLSRHRLYTAASRATGRLDILAEGELTPLLKDYEPLTGVQDEAED